MSVETLRKCALFRGLSENGLQAMASIASERSIPAGTPLFVENTLGDALYVVHEGMLRISLQEERKSEKVLTIISEGEAFGELSLLSPAPRMVSAVAESDSVVLEIRRGDFLRLQASSPKACLKLILAIVERFRLNLQENRANLGALLRSTSK